MFLAQRMRNTTHSAVGFDLFGILNRVEGDFFGCVHSRFRIGPYDQFARDCSFNIFPNALSARPGDDDCARAAFSMYETDQPGRIVDSKGVSKIFVAFFNSLNTPNFRSSSATRFLRRIEVVRRL